MDTRFTLEAEPDGSGFLVIDQDGEYPAEYAGERRRTAWALSNHRNGAHQNRSKSAAAGDVSCLACATDSGRFADPGLPQFLVG